MQFDYRSTTRYYSCTAAIKKDYSSNIGDIYSLATQYYNMYTVDVTKNPYYSTSSSGERLCKISDHAHKTCVLIGTPNPISSKPETWDVDTDVLTRTRNTQKLHYHPAYPHNHDWPAANKYICESFRARLALVSKDSTGLPWTASSAPRVHQHYLQWTKNLRWERYTHIHTTSVTHTHYFGYASLYSSSIWKEWTR